LQQTKRDPRQNFRLYPGAGLPIYWKYFVLYVRNIPTHLTISVEKKIELPGFGHWTIKQDQYAVQPPVSILEHIMRQLLQHASNRTKSGRRRRIIYIEFSNVKLPMGLEWAEQIGKGIWPEEGVVRGGQRNIVTSRIKP